jgi:hypothetical protein
MREIDGHHRIGDPDCRHRIVFKTVVHELLAEWPPRPMTKIGIVEQVFHFVEDDDMLLSPTEN